MDRKTERNIWNEQIRLASIIQERNRRRVGTYDHIVQDVLTRLAFILFAFTLPRFEIIPKVGVLLELNN